MPTVIDALLVELSLDASKFTEGQKKALDALKKTKDSAGTTGKELEARGKQGSEFFSLLATSAMKFLATIGSASAITAFIKNTVVTEAATGRLARNLGIGGQELHNWQEALKRVGGTAEEANSALAAMSNTLTVGGFTGTNPLAGFMRALGIAPTDEMGKWKSSTETMLEVADEIKRRGLSARDAIGLMSIGGISGNLANLLLDPEKLRAYLAEAQKLSPLTDDQIQKSQELQAQWERSWSAFSGGAREAVNDFKPSIGAVLDLATDFIDLERHLPTWERLLNILNPAAHAGTVVGEMISNWLKSKSGGGGVSVSGVIGGGASASGASASSGPTGYGIETESISPSEQMNRDRLRVSILEREYAANPNDPALRSELSEARARVAANNPWKSQFHNRGAMSASDPSLLTGARAGVAGSGTGGNSTSTSSVSIGQITIHTQATDAKGIVADIGPALRNYGLAAQSNTGLN